METSLNDQAVGLAEDYQRTGRLEHLDEAIRMMEQVTDMEGEYIQPDILSNLWAMLGMRFERTGLMEDLNSAVEVAGQAVDATPHDHPNRVDLLNNLGNLLGRRFERTGSMEDLNRKLSSYKEGWRCTTAPPSIRIRSARQAARILASQLDWEGSSLLLHEAVNLLPTVSPRSLHHTDKQHMLADFAGFASTAAAAALNAGQNAYHTLHLLELGRGVIAGLLMEMRGDISDLKQRHPGLADEFTSLRDELDAPTNSATSLSSPDSTSSWESQARRRREADEKFTNLIAEIRAQPGLQNFLLPPTADELMAAANPDPLIVVNLSSYRCDAFLIERDRIRVLELPGLTLEGVQERASKRSSRPAGAFDVASLLEWLWDVVARPCLHALGFKDPVSDNNWPRVWWIPTGILSQLPLHAAGRYAQKSAETVLDRVMSSYASSVKALIYGRRHHVRKSAKPLSGHALLIDMHETPGLALNRSLPSVKEEVKILDGVCQSLQLKPITLTKPRKDDVLKHLPECRIFHFAGHGQSDPVEPSRSCLLLEDWETNPLTVGDLRDHRLQENPPFLGFLSACSTGANEAVRLADEGIQLVSAFQLAGFRHVVGTLWEVSDKHCVDAARVLYETLREEGMTDVAVCRGFHRAVRALRDEGIKDWEARDAKLVCSGTQARGLPNPYWVPYVHFGV